MRTLLASCLVLFAAAAAEADLLENAAAIAARLGAIVAVPEAAAIASPSAQPLAAAAAFVRTSGSIYTTATATGSGPLECYGSPTGHGWIDLRAEARVTTADGASAQFPVTGSVLLDGPCRLGFVTGNTWMNGSGTLYKDGRPVGTVSLSGAIFINQYVTGTFVWVAQDVFLSGRYDETDDSAR